MGKEKKPRTRRNAIVRKQNSMSLSISERLVLMGVLSNTASDIVTVRIVREMIDNFSFSDAEIKKFKIEKLEDGSGGIDWDHTKKHIKNIPLGSVARSVIVIELKNLESRKQLQLQHLEIWDKFVEDK